MIRKNVGYYKTRPLYLGITILNIVRAALEMNFQHRSIDS